MASLVTTTINGTLTGNSSATFDSSIRTKSQLRVSNDYSINYFYKTNNTTMLGYLLMRDDNNSLLSFPAGQDFRLMHANTTRIAVKTDGNVGIGTPTPDSTLHVKEIDTDEDAIIKISPNNGSYDPVLQFTPQDGTLDNEGFEIWYDNNVGDAHIHTIYNNDAAAIRFHTRTGASKSTSNERLTIAGDGNVGIGTTGPSQKLHINGLTKLGASGKTEGGAIIGLSSFGETKGVLSTILGNSIVPGTANSTIQRSTSNIAHFLKINETSGITFHTGLQTTEDANVAESTNEKVRIDITGKVGIGTTSPNYKLDVNTGLSSGGGIGYPVRVGHGSMATAGDGVGVLFSRGSAEQYFGYVRIQSTQSNPDYLNPRLEFGIQDTDSFNLADASTRMVITGDGNVGIGITNPNKKLEVVDSAAAQILAKGWGPDSAGNDGGAIQLGEEATFHGLFSYDNATSILYIDNAYNSSSGDIRFRTKTSGTAITAVTIEGDGNVGIGTVSPSTKLEVVGETKSTNYRFSGPSDGGAVPAYSNSSYKTVKYNEAERATELVSSTDNAIGMAFPAFRVNESAGEQWKLWVQYKASASSSTGFYARVYEYSAELPDGKIAVSNSASNPVVQEDTSSRTDWKINVAISTTWVTSTYTYTPNSNAKWASIVLLNWTGMGYNSLYARVGKERFFGTSSVITGSGTVNKLPLWDGTNSLTDSRVSQTASSIEILGASGQGYSKLLLKPDTGASLSLLELSHGPDPNNASVIIYGRGDSSYATINSTKRGTGVTKPINFDIDSDEKMRIDTSGNVGIGAISPDEKLHIGSGASETTNSFVRVDGNASKQKGFNIYGDGTEQWRIYTSTSSSDLRFYDGSNVTVTFEDGGNVGISATTPTGKLQIGDNYTINASYGGDDIYIKGTANKASYDPNVYNTDDIGALITISDSDTVGPTKPGLVLYNDDVTAGGFSPMLLFSKRETGSSPFKATMAGIYARAPLGTGDSGGWIDGELIFATAGAASHGVKQRMVINKEGNVGIGTIAPSQALTVAGKIDAKNAMGVAGQWSSSQIRLETTNTVDTTGWHGISFDASTTDNYGWSIGVNRSGSGRGSFRFYEHVNSATGTERFTIEQDGNVGIGIADPKQTVHIGKSASNTLGPVLMLDNTAGGATDSSAIIFASGGDTYHRAKIVSTVEGASAYLGNLGFYTGRSDTTGVTEKMRITGAGNVGINTTTPTSKLQIVGSTSGDSVLRVDGTNGTLFEVVDDLSDSLMSVNDAAGLPVFEVFADNHIVAGRYNQNDFYLNTNGNLGLGTANPSGGKLHITNGVGNGSGVCLYVDGSGDIRCNNGGSLFFGAYDYGGSTYIRGYDSSAGLYFYADGVNRLQVGSDINIQGATDLNINGSSRRLSFTSGTGTIRTTSANKLYLQTNGTDALTIDASQNVGIGITSPSQKLDVAGAGRFTSGVIVPETNSGGFEYRTNSAWGGWARDAFTIANGTGGNFFSLGGYGGSGTTFTYGYIGKSYTDYCIRFYLDGAVELTHNDVTKLSTTSTGVTVTGTLTADYLSGDGSSLSSLSGSNIGSGTVPAARLGSGSSITTKFLRGDNTWQTVSSGSSPNNSTITLTAGTNLNGGGDFTTNQSSNEEITFNLDTAGPGAGSYGSTSDGTKIDTITLDAYGRVTAVSTGATGSGSMSSWNWGVDSASTTSISNGETVRIKGGTNVTVSRSGNDVTINSGGNIGTITGVTAGTGLTGGGTSGAVTIDMDTAGPGAGNYGSTSDGTKIDLITLDAYGRVTAVSTGNTGDITTVNAGAGLTGGGITGGVTLSLGNVGPGAGVYGSADDDVKIDTITLDVHGRVTALTTGPIAGGSGTITGVTAGNGLTGGGTSGGVTLNVVGGNGISVAANSIAVEGTVCTQITSPSGTAIPQSSSFTFAQSGGMTISASGKTVTFSSSSASDYRLKKNVTDFNSESWTKVKSVNCRKFDFDAEKFAQAMEDDYTIQRPASYGGRIGFIAHELQAAGIDGAVEGEKDEVDENGVPIYQKVSYTTLVPVLWGALNEAIRKIEILESKVQNLENSS